MRSINFSAGPSVLPESVLEQAAREMFVHGDSGMSVMEMSHRSKAYGEIIADARASLARLLHLPENYHILFLQGGATTQFSAVPLNLMSEGGRAAYINSGSWSKKAIAEARKYGEVLVSATSEDVNFLALPEIRVPAEPVDYLHITTNNTIVGTCFHQIPQLEGQTLVADMSSNFLSAPVDVSRFGLIYAGAQKNAGPAGLTIVVVRKDLVGRPRAITPVMLDYHTHVKADSMYNTPPTYAIYIAGLVFKWIEAQGGLEAMAARNREKAALLYDFLDESQHFKALVAEPDRSWMNIPFTLGDPELDARFLAEAATKGLVNLKGHRSVGGLRASLYNAMPLEGVQTLVSFMKTFEAQLAPVGGPTC